MKKTEDKYMAKIKLEAEDFVEQKFETLEHCCFCFYPTMFWVKINGKVTGKSVACCMNCALQHDMSEVPTKEQWCAQVMEKYPILK
jgi:Zn-finger protein